MMLTVLTAHGVNMVLTGCQQSVNRVLTMLTAQSVNSVNCKVSTGC